MSYSRTVQLPVTPDEAFALITEPERLRRWQVVTATVDLRVGGDYRWTVTPGHLAGGTFKEIVPGKQVVFGWGWDGMGDLDLDASTVTISLEANEHGTAVTLVHEGLDEQQAAHHAEGWDHFLHRLVVLATDGDAGQDEWAWAPESLDPMVAAEATLAAFQPVLRNLTADDRPKRTTCEEFTCQDLAEHLVGSLQRLGSMAGATMTDPEEDGSLENRISVIAGQTIAAWRARGLEGTVAGPGGQETPAAFLAGVLPVELLLHAWDMAQGSGQALRVSDELVAYVAGLAEDVVPGGRGGSFAQEKLVPEQAPAMNRLAAFAGRTPINA